MAQLIPENALQVRPERKTSLEWKYAGWAAAALISIAGSFVLERGVLRNQLASATNAALATEVCDEHIAMLAGGGIPQVVSTDRHTVKPWFQGKIPFSFNLPASLPSDIVLDGANLAYLHNRPAAQLLYSIGHHHVSVFLQEKDGESGTISAEHAGFHVAEVSSGGLEAVAVSDVDSARLWELVRAVGAAQTASHH
jgi:anti-sigma factor RsiW